MSAEGIRPDPDKLRAVAEYPTPSNPKDLRSFLGLCTYFRRFIPGLSHVAEPLYEVLRGAVNFTWGSAKEQSFAALKEALTSVFY